MTELFNSIAFLAKVHEDDPVKRDEKIAPLVEYLHQITKYQEALGELPNQIYWRDKKS